MKLLRLISFLLTITVTLGAVAEEPQAKARVVASLKKISEGDTLYSLLKKHRFSEQQVRVILQERTLPKGYALAPKDRYQVRRDRENGRTEVKLYDPFEDSSYVFWREGKEAGSQKQAQQFEVKTRTLKGRIYDSVVGTINKFVTNWWVAYRFVDAYVLDFNLRKDVKRGAHFSLTFEEKYDGKHFVKYGEILDTKLEVNGKMESRKFLAFDDGGVFVEKENDHLKRPLYAPVDYLHFSSLYKPRRYHPIKKRYQAHLGIDFALPEGENIYAAYAGKVLRSGRNRAAGNFVVIRHPNGLETYYNHMSQLAEGIRPGRYVSNGELIGFIGCTGYCTKSHLHFAVKKNGRFVNPIRYIKSYPFRKKSLVEKFASLFPEN